MSKTLNAEWIRAKEKYPDLTHENFIRINILYDFLQYKKQTSFPDPFSRIEVIISPKTVTRTDILTLLHPDSPFEIVDGGPSQKILLYKGEFVDTVELYDQTSYNMKSKEPYYFYVREVRGELVLKLNPVQLCNFFQNPQGEQPCIFCFRNDMVSRFRNISAVDLVSLIRKESKQDADHLLSQVDEISLITGSYTNDDEYIDEITSLIGGLRPYVRGTCRVVVGSHEGKGRKMYERMKAAGVTTFAFPLESLDDMIRAKKMKNRKGLIPMKNILSDIEEAIAVFGDDGVIIRTIAGMGDTIDDSFHRTVSAIASMGERGPQWNVNIYMPFTHYHWRVFADRGFSKEYLYHYCSVFNSIIAPERYWNFKISP